MPDDAHRRSTLLLIDVEPDARKPPARSHDGWEGTRAALPLVEDLRRQLAARTAAPVVFNWFLRSDPQIEETWGTLDAVDRLVPGLVDAIRARGDYTGIHPHLWRWSAETRDWYNDFRDEAWMERCLDTAIAGHSALFGQRPEACRFGDRWTSDAALRALRARGIRFDLTPEPGRPAEPPPGDGSAVGTLPDTRDLPRVPFEAVAGAGPWILPVTTSQPRWQPAWYAPFVVRASVSPNLCLSPLLIVPHLRRELARDTSAPCVLTLRSGDLGNRRRLACFRRNVAALLAQPGLARCDFTTPPTAIARWAAKASR